VDVAAYGRAGLGASAPSGDPVILARRVSDLASVITSTASGPCVPAGHSWDGILSIGAQPPKTGNRRSFSLHSE